MKALLALLDTRLFIIMYIIYYSFDSNFPSLMNIIREPVDQLISQFYYIRTIPKFTDSMEDDVIDMVSFLQAYKQPNIHFYENILKYN